MTVQPDDYYLERALSLARLSATVGEVPVGAVIVGPDGNILAEAHNEPIRRHDPTAHAEILAIRLAAVLLNNYRLIDCTLYVTLEPCAMCAGAISNARIKRLIFSASDEKGGAVLHGPRYFEQPTCHWHPDISHGRFAHESAGLLREFFRDRRQKPLSSER